ncbi:MAG: pilus assembly protein N-terminal domain-containing protein [Candidatus Gastranaerophilales bacterium]|nr:pilus assembly protein N-terminal domain-containing protein [Candidatus Gastranaerophilales bacterium]
MANPVLAANLPNIRGLNNDPISIQNKFDSAKELNSLEDNVDTNKQPSNTQLNLKKKPALKGNVSELTAIVGKSQLIRFDEPVKRISLTNPALADLVLISPREMLLNGKSGGLTSLIIWGEKGDPAFFNLYVKNDSSQFLNAVKATLPNEYLDFKFTNDSNVVLSGKVSSTLVKDQVKNLAQAYGLKIVDMAESPVPQVMIEVRVVEASRSLTNSLKSNFGLGKLADSFIKGYSITALDNVNTNAADFKGTASGLRLLVHKHELSSMLAVAEQKGLAKILAEPKLMATNGSKASFNAGQEIPFPSSVDRNGNVAYEFKKVGVNVSFTPTIMEKSGRISLNISPEVSEIDSSTAITIDNNVVVYGIKTRKADTTVELNDGQTLIMAGLLQRTDNSVKNQIPIIGNIPILGQLFRSDEYRKGETELLIFVTPRIIQPENKVDGV